MSTIARTLLVRLAAALSVAALALAGGIQLASAGASSFGDNSETVEMLPSLDGATAWIQSPPLTAESLRGKVVLVDFWTYSCINCLRTLPYIRAWAQKYRAQGLVVLGVHTPEFDFEKDPGNVLRAVQDLKIDYQVAVDSKQALWRAFGTRAWPTLYFVDAQGRIRQQQLGEGRYDKAERMIQQLLREAGRTDVKDDLVTPQGPGTQAAPAAVPAESGETYLGFAQAEGFRSAEGGLRTGPVHSYAAARSLQQNEWTLAGTWTVTGEHAQLDKPGGRIAYRFRARDLHLVLGPSREGAPIRFRVRIDGKAPRDDHGTDIDANGLGQVDSYRLYQLVRQRASTSDHLFEIEFLDPGVRAYAFTFG